MFINWIDACVWGIRRGIEDKEYVFKGTVMQIEKAFINIRVRVSKVSWKFHFPAIYNFAVIYPWNLLFS